MNLRGATAIFITIAAAVIILIALFVTIPMFSPPTKVSLETTMGTITIELYSDMPITSGNFEKLVREGFYDGVLFHRVIPNFVIQGGDPLTKDESKKGLWGTGGSEPIRDEFKDHSNKKYTISMANAGPNTGSSQFFINLADNIFLDSRHPAFGEVVEGIDVVDEIAQVQTDSGDTPIEPVKIISAKIIE